MQPCSSNAIYVGDTSKIDRGEWLEWRKHGRDGDIPVTLTGTNIGSLFGVSKYASAYELWDQKRKEYIRFCEAMNKGEKLTPLPSRDDANAAMRDGVFNESYVSRRYEDQTGMRIVNQPGMYQNGTHHFALADPDGFVLKDDAPANPAFPVAFDYIEKIWEGKTTDDRIPEQREIIRDWRNGIPPISYVYQIMHYMFTIGIKKTDISCLWGIHVDEWVNVPFELDAKSEEILIENETAFVENVVKGVRPPAPIGEEELLRAVKAQFPVSVDKDVIVRFDPRMHGRIIERYVNLTKREKALSHTLKELNKAKAQTEGIIRLILEGHENGVMETATAEYLIKCVNRSRVTIPTEALLREQPDIYARYKKESKWTELNIKTRIKEGR